MLYRQCVESMLCLQTSSYDIVIENDPLYTPGSADHLRTYGHQYWLGEQDYRPSSQHSLRVMKSNIEVASCILLTTGGPSGVHEHSASLHELSCIIAVGPFMCSLEIPHLHLQWYRQVDRATCFGVYYASKHNCYISHGELEITCVSCTGELKWSVSGRDIFTNGFYLHDDYVEVVDWNDEVYHIELPCGESWLVTA